MYGMTLQNNASCVISWPTSLATNTCGNFPTCPLGMKFFLATRVQCWSMVWCCGVIHLFTSHSLPCPSSQKISRCCQNQRWISIRLTPSPHPKTKIVDGWIIDASGDHGVRLTHTTQKIQNYPTSVGFVDPVLIFDAAAQVYQAPAYLLKNRPPEQLHSKKGLSGLRRIMPAVRSTSRFIKGRRLQ